MSSLNLHHGDDLLRRDYASCATESAYPELWQGLVGAWVPMLGWRGDMLPDWSGYKVHGKLTGITNFADWNNDPEFVKLGNLSTFPGSSGRVLLSSTVPKHLQTPTITVIARVQVNDSPATAVNAGIVSCLWDTGTTEYNWGLSYRTGTYGGPGASFSVRTETDGLSGQYKPLAVWTGERSFPWTTFVGRYDGKTTWLDAYQHGVRVGSVSNTLATGGPIRYREAQELNIGLHHDDNETVYLYGRVSHVFIYNRDIGAGLSAAIAANLDGDTGDGANTTRRGLRPGLMFVRKRINYMVGTGTVSALSPTAANAIELASECSATITRRLSAASSLDALDHAIVCSAVRYRPSEPTPLQLTQLLEYVGPKVASAAAGLTLTQDARRAWTYSVTASSALAVATSAGSAGTIRQSASSALALLSVADQGVFFRSVETMLDLSDGASGDCIKFADNTLVLISSAEHGSLRLQAANALSLSSQARKTPLNIGPTGDVILPASAIVIGQKVGINIKMLSAGSLLVLSDTIVAHKPWYVEAVSDLTSISQAIDPATLQVVTTDTGLRAEAAVTKEGASNAVRQYLQLVQVVGVVRLKADALDAAAASEITLTDTLRTGAVGSAGSQLVLACGAVADRANPLRSVLGLTQEAVRTITRTQVCASALALDDSFTYVIYRDMYLREYHPFGGKPATGSPTSIPASLAPPAEEPGAVRLSGVGSVTLRSPNFGNKDRLSFNRVLRETRGGSLIMYADPAWPKTQTMTLSFSGLKQAEKDALLEFLWANLGRDVSLVDWEGRTWTGIIIVPNEPVVQDDRTSYSASFEFEALPA